MLSLRVGDYFFVCDPGLPHRAVVTKVQFTLRDTDSSGEATTCALVRHSLAPASVGTFEKAMAVFRGLVTGPLLASSAGHAFFTDPDGYAWSIWSPIG